MELDIKYHILFFIFIGILLSFLFFLCYKKKKKRYALVLFYSMGHEFQHVSQHALLQGVSVASVKSTLFSHVKEFTAYSYGNSLGNPFSTGGYGPGGPYHHWVSDIMRHPYYSKFLHYNFEWTRTVNFTNIFN